MSFFRHHDHTDPAPSWVAGLYHNQLLIYDLLAQTREQQRHIMSALDDLKAAIADLGTAVTDGITEIEALLAKITAPGTSDADVQAAVAQITGITAGIKDEVAKAKSVSP